FWEEHLRGGAGAGEPSVHVFVQRGGWRAAPSWPPPGVEQRALYPSAVGGLGPAAAEGSVDYQSTPTVGVTGGQWDTLGTGVGYPLDQGPDDSLSLTFTSEPLVEPLELAGSPTATLEVQRLDDDGPLTIVAKLLDVSPDGRAEL